MQYTTLGRTGLKVSVAGLGCGGNSALGLAKGKGEANAIAVVHKAMDLGVNLFDTAKGYETEVALGKAIRGRPRDSAVICTKSQAKRGDDITPLPTMLAELDQSLRNLGVETIDLYQLQGARPEHYDQLCEEHVPALLKEREKGKFRFLGITENMATDTTNRMAVKAAQSGIWDVMMIGFHMLNQHPREHVFPHTIKNDIGVIVMYAVRAIFSRPKRLNQAIREEVDAGRLPTSIAEDSNPLSFLMEDGGAVSLTDAAYRFVRHEPGCTVTLFGTGDVDHVEANVESVLRPPLAEPAVQRLRDTFGHLVGVGLDNNGRPAGWGQDSTR